MAQTMKSKLAWVLIVLGLSVFCCGFAYDVLFAGIPYQDPTPALAASYQFHAGVAAAIRRVGVGICLLSAIALFIQWLRMRGHHASG